MVAEYMVCIWIIYGESMDNLEMWLIYPLVMSKQLLKMAVYSAFAYETWRCSKVIYVSLPEGNGGCWMPVSVLVPFSEILLVKINQYPAVC